VKKITENKILLAGGAVGSTIKSDLKPTSHAGMQNKIDEYLIRKRKEASLNTDFTKDTNKIYSDLKEKNYFTSEGTFNEGMALQKGKISLLKSWAERNKNLVLEIADNAKIKLYERKDRYDDPGSISVSKTKIELAEDDRVLGIPYAQAMAGDRVYVINGKVFTGWALYYSLSSIRSPEDYAKNVDLVYNVPYLYASILLKAQLGLGCGFDVNYGAETTEVPEERLINRYLFEKLKINEQKLIKTAFHLGQYGNSYWAIRRDKKGLPDKITILQPERMKIFLDPMTTKIMFYIYLPPIIGGTTIAAYPSDGKVNPNILTGVTLSYPTPIVIHPEDMMHFKINDFTEYPFGFSEVKTIADPASARLDINILAPIIYKKYTKPMIHWSLDTEGLGAKQVNAKLTEMEEMLEDMEPGSDPITTKLWTPTVISINTGKSSLLELTGDIDTQIFAATGAPETYFKPKGSTDRMISEQDKTFLARLKVPQSIVAEQIEDKLIKPRVFHELQQKKEIKEYMGDKDVVEDILETYDSWMASEPKYPKVVWKEIFKQDETQSIANAIALQNAGIIDANRAAMKIGEIPLDQQEKEDVNKIGIDDVYSPPFSETELGKKESPQPSSFQQAGDDKRAVGNTPSTFNEQENMETLRGGLNVKTNFETNNRNVTDTKDPSQLGGSRYEQSKTKGKKGDISEKNTGLN